MTTESLERTVQLVLRKLVLASAAEASTDDKAASARVHAVRKRIKRIRAILRLVEDGLDQTDYRREQAWFRDRGRRLSAVRDADVLVETHRKLQVRAYGETDDVRNDDRVLQALERSRAKTFATAPPARLLGEIAGDLEAKATEWDVAPLRITNPAALGEALEPSLRRYARALHRAEHTSTGARFHTWRKRVKDVTYQMDFMVRQGMELQESLRRQAVELGHLLGWEHDIFMYAKRLRSLDGVPPKLRAQWKRTAKKERRRLKKRTLRYGRRFLGRAGKRLNGKAAASGTSGGR